MRRVIETSLSETSVVAITPAAPAVTHRQNSTPWRRFGLGYAMTAIEPCSIDAATRYEVSVG